tara:strand:+ start:469 stop:939 length:471 start_codon:yes stop_codon:yes gene_type:complete
MPRKAKSKVQAETIKEDKSSPTTDETSPVVASTEDTQILDPPPAVKNEEENIADDEKSQSAVVEETTAKAYGKASKRKTSDAKEQVQPKKRSKNSFMFFCEANRAKIKESNGALSVTAIAKLLGEQWKELADEDKQIYVQKANKAKEEFEAMKLSQ